MFQLAVHWDTAYMHPLSYKCYTGPKRGTACQAGITAQGHGEKGGQVKTPPAARCRGHLSAGKEDLTPRSCESLVHNIRGMPLRRSRTHLIRSCVALTLQPMTIIRSCFTKMHGSGVTPKEGGNVQYVHRLRQFVQQPL